MEGLVVQLEVDGKRYLFIDEALFRLTAWLFCIFFGMGICSLLYVAAMFWQQIVG